jgi:serine/threonine protein phosphatase PrpC
MVDWIKKKLDNKEKLQDIVENLLDELVSKDSGNQYGMDNMSAILIQFSKKK